MNPLDFRLTFFPDLPLVVIHFRVINGTGSCHPRCDFASLLQDDDITNPSFYRYRDVHCDRTDKPAKQVKWFFRTGSPLPYHFQL